LKDTNSLCPLFDNNAGGVVGPGSTIQTSLCALWATAAGNCRQLEAAHLWCLSWARRHGGKFAPNKYKLIHFTRRRRGSSRWASHVQEAARKGEAQFEALGHWPGWWVRLVPGAPLLSLALGSVSTSVLVRVPLRGLLATLSSLISFRFCG
jgi:hypothetical protein